ncbi:MAG: alpha-amylase family glycosyl hydrolase [Candidatus Thermoplasmatota archaeon]|nr:alpha-amylase family glycosyl hydrolase [Candidatus Thermoplasmatota archaeon]MEC8680759.1 alpha-amylase family glycosyl hydrolase [Candidatus Thermoplasmatota archaeon]
MLTRTPAAMLVALLLIVVASPLVTNDAEAATGRSGEFITLTYTGNATSVELIGEWNWSETLTMTRNGDVWSVDVELSEGLYCYKFIVDGAYIFDPSNPERVYCDDIENSLLRVDDHLRPHYTAALTDVALEVTYHAGSTGALHDGVPSALAGATWDDMTSTWTLPLSSLVDGKHTMKIEGFDTDGHPAYDLLVPFWTGPHADFVWEDALVYMIMTDRFVNGNTSNDGTSTGATQGADWQGGDFAGVTQMIESGYFADLGVNALWLTPFNTAATGTGKAADGVHDVSAFHGYWPIEARGVEPRLGTEAELQAMIEAAHDDGMRVMMDYVVNHVHEDHEYVQNNSDWFNTGCICGQADCDWTEHRLDCQFTAYMPDVNWKNRQASEQMIADALWWMETFDLDGARIDAVKHVENLAVSNLVAQINERFETVGNDVYLKGETAMGWSGHSLEDNQAQYGAINAYMGPDGLDGQADFVLYHAVVDNVFVSGNENYQHLDFWTNRSQDQYTPGSLMVPYVGSHDVPRLTSRADTGTGDAYNQWVEDGLPGQPGDVSAYHAALQAYGWLLTTPGAPLLYYGDEYGEYGGADPDNRHMYRAQSSWSDHEAALFENISQLGQLRLESIALRQGVYSTRLAMANLLAYNMTHDEQAMTVVLNRGGPTQLSGFATNDTVRFGSGPLANGSLTVPAHSVTVIELNAVVDQPSTNETDGNTTVPGCTDPTAENYNSSATVDDGSCTYPPLPVPGCTDETATNYDAAATEDDGTCQYETDPEDPCADVVCDACPQGWTTLPAEEGGCCPICIDPNENNQSGDGSTNETTTNGTANNGTAGEGTGNATNGTNNETNMQICDLCCGETYEHPADEPCPVAMCEPCEEEEASTTTSSAVTVRNVLIGAVLLLVLMLVVTGRSPPKQELDGAFEAPSNQENFS